jgi:putative tryptophan/tyrosine transport system substrate-binding protein
VTRRHCRHRLALGALLIALQVSANLSPAPAEAQEAAISGTITLDPSLKDRLPKEPLLLIVASKSQDPKKPPFIVKRVPGVVLPYEYTLTEEDITLVGSTFEGKLYVTARIETGDPPASGRLEGTHPKNPVAVGSSKVDIRIAPPDGTPAATKTVPAPSRPGGGKVLRVGLLWSGSTPFDSWSVPEALRQAFFELGYVDGQNIAFEPRYAEGNYDRLPGFAAELVRLEVDVILAAGDSAAVVAAKNATAKIPIVMMALADTVQLGLVASLARPGGNITGLSFPLAAMAAKQLELLKKAVPQASRVAVLWNPANPGHAPVLADLKTAAQTLKVRLEPVEVRGPDDFDAAFVTVRQSLGDAVLVLWDPMLYAHGGRLTLLALRTRLPTISTYGEFTAAAGLMAYGPRLVDIFRGAASYVDKIVRGARPADLPVERPVRLELVVNLATAKVLGITLPQVILVRTDRVIR